MECAVSGCLALTRAVLTRLDNCAWIRSACETLRPHVLQVKQILDELGAVKEAAPLLGKTLQSIEGALKSLDAETLTWERESRIKVFATSKKRKEALQEAAKALGRAMSELAGANVQLTEKVRAGVQDVQGGLSNLQVVVEEGVERLGADLAKVMSQGEDMDARMEKMEAREARMEAMLEIIVGTFASPSVDAAQEQRSVEKVLADTKCFKPGHEKQGVTIVGNMAAEIRRIKEQEQKRTLAEALENLVIEPKRIQVSNQAISHEGGSTVYGGVWDRDGTGTDLCNVAVKVVEIGGDLVSAHEDVERVKNEAERMVRASLCSDHVCTLHGYVVDKDRSRVMLVMRRYPSSVSQRLRGQGRLGPLSVDNKLQICRNIFQGLADLHAMGICHFDMKPANVLLTEHGTAVLTDFQLSRETNKTLGKTLREKAFGTMNYMPPEQMHRTGRDKPGTHSDMWSAAATVCEILSGEMPFQDNEGPEILAAVLINKERPKIPAWAPAALRSLLERCFESKAAKRPTAIEALEVMAKLTADDVQEGGDVASAPSDSATLSVSAARTGGSDGLRTTLNGDGRVTTQVVRKILADKTRDVVDLKGAVVTIAPSKVTTFVEEEYSVDEQYHETEEYSADEQYYDTEIRLVEGKKKLFGGRKMVETPVQVQKTRRVKKTRSVPKTRRVKKTRWVELPAGKKVPAGGRSKKVVELDDGIVLDRAGVTLRNASIEYDVPAADEYRSGAKHVLLVSAPNVTLENVKITVRTGGKASEAMTALAVQGCSGTVVSNCAVAVKGSTAGVKSVLSVSEGGNATLSDCTIICDRACSGHVTGSGSRLEMQECHVTGAGFVAEDGGQLQVDGGALTGAQVCFKACGGGSVAEVSGCSIRHGGVAGQVSQGGAMELRDCEIVAVRGNADSLQVDGAGSVLSLRGGFVEGGKHAAMASGGALLLASGCTLKESFDGEAIITSGQGTRAELARSITYECLLRTEEGQGSEIAIVDETARVKQVLERREAERREAERREAERREAERREAERREAELRRLFTVDGLREALNAGSGKSVRAAAAMSSASATACVAATGLTGLVAGSMTFASFVSTRTLLDLVDRKDTATLQRLFPVWWPKGRDLMVPLLGAATVAHGCAYGLTRDRAWLLTGALTFSILPYTKLVIMRDVGPLMDTTTDGAAVDRCTRRFCRNHHARLAASTASFLLSLLALAQPR
ncbi:unnamed protein product [Pedinophyceae sp. YPF-701]|nr:unnamed protein product [Pedinophyceae sp. YPF-701]